MANVFVIGDKGLPSIQNTANVERQKQEKARTKTATDENPTDIISHTVHDSSCQNDSDQTIEEENLDHKVNANVRFEEFKSILSNDQVQVDWSKFAFNILGTLLTNFVMTIPLSLIPVHNVFYQPNYWYETSLQQSFHIAWMGFYFIITCEYCLNITHIKTIRNILIVCLSGVIQTWVFYTTGYYVWSYALKFKYPIPFIGYTVAVFAYTSQIVTLWFCIPLSWRRKKHFRRRLKFCFLSFLFMIFAIPFPYQIFGKLFDMFRNAYQPIIALCLPLVREFNGWVMATLNGKAAKSDITGSKLIGGYMVCTWHGVFLCYCIGSLTTDITSWLIMGIDFLINIYLSLRLVWVKKRRPDDIEKQYAMLLEIVISELTEFLVPLAFLLTFIASYYGPNSNLIGNVGSSYWQYDAIDDGIQYVRTILMFFFIDFCSFVASGIILWLFCKINLAKAFVTLEKEFAWYFCVQLSVLVQVVSRTIKTK